MPTGPPKQKPGLAVAAARAHAGAIANHTTSEFNCAADTFNVCRVTARVAVTVRDRHDHRHGRPAPYLGRRALASSADRRTNRGPCRVQRAHRGRRTSRRDRPDRTSRGGDEAGDAKRMWHPRRRRPPPRKQCRRRSPPRPQPGRAEKVLLPAPAEAEAGRRAAAGSGVRVLGSSLDNAHVRADHQTSRGWSRG
jgi:hypothetical protein